MSDIVTASVIGGAVTLILGYMQRRTQIMVARIEHNTNGMQKTIEKLAFNAGVDEERAREKQ